MHIVDSTWGSVLDQDVGNWMTIAWDPALCLLQERPSDVSWWTCERDQKNKEHDNLGFHRKQRSPKWPGWNFHPVLFKFFGLGAICNDRGHRDAEVHNRTTRVLFSYHAPCVLLPSVWSKGEKKTVVLSWPVKYEGIHSFSTCNQPVATKMRNLACLKGGKRCIVYGPYKISNKAKIFRLSMMY